MLNVSIPHTKTTPRVPKSHFPTSRPPQRLSRRLLSWEAWGHHFRLKFCMVPLCVHFGVPGCPKWGRRRPKVPKRCQKGAQKLTFRSPKGHFWVPSRREWSLAKTLAGAMFSSHYEGPGPSLFAPKIASGTHCAPETLLFPLLCPL